MRHPHFVCIVVVLAFFQSSICQPCNPELDYSIYFNGTSFFTVSSSNGTCYCDSYVSSGASVFYGGVGHPGGQTTINSQLVVDDSATFSSGITVAGTASLTGPTFIAAASIQGTLSALGPVSAGDSMSVVGAVTADSFAGDGSALTNLDQQPDVAAISALLADALAVIANQTSQLVAQSALIASQASQISTQASQISTQAGQISWLQANATAQQLQIASQQSQISTQASQISSLQANATAHQLQITSQASQISTQASQISTLISRVDGHDAALSSHNSTLTSHTNLLTTQAAQISNQTAQITTLQGQASVQSSLSSALTDNVCSEFNGDLLNHNQIFVNNTLFTIGGGWNKQSQGGPEASTIVEYFNPLCNMWRSGPPSVYAHKFPGIAYVNGEIYVLAGFDGNAFATSVNCEKFNILNNSWIQLPPLYVGRQAPAATTIGTDIYVIGGRTEQNVGMSDYNNKYNGTGVWYNMTGNQTPRRGAVALSLNGLLYLMGGAGSTLNILLASVECYNPKTDQWIFVKSMLQALNTHAGAVLNNRFWITGGNAGGSAAVSTVQIYTPQSDSWAWGPSMLQPRQEHIAGVVNNELIVAGGTNFSASSSEPWPIQATVDKYSPATNAWASQAPMITKRNAMGGIGVGPY